LATADELLDGGVRNTLSFGPALVVDSVPVTDFSGVEIDKNFGLRSIQGLNPRTGLGMITPGHYVFIVVDGRSAGYSKGMTLEDFAQVFANYGCSVAYNLDGGGSSSMYFNGRIVNDPLGKGQERGTSDVVAVLP
jgi:exopolysaccharide biosynthesis protein